MNLCAMYSTCNRLRYTKVTLPLAWKFAGNRARLIVHDDASEDGTDGWLKAWCTGKPGVSLHIEPERRGIACSTNFGFRTAVDEGFDAVAILDNDILVPPGWLDRLSAMLHVHPEISLLSGHIVNDWTVENMLMKSQEIGDGIFDTGGCGGAFVAVRTSVMKEHDLWYAPCLTFSYEDAAFHEKCVRRGLRIGLDTRLQAWHLQTIFWADVSYEREKIRNRRTARGFPIDDAALDKALRYEREKWGVE